MTDKPCPSPSPAQPEAAGGGEGGSGGRAPRHNEWTREKRANFLRELAACQNVSQAAESVGMSRQSAYRLRDRLPGTPFALGWEVALEHGFAHLAHAVMDRALNGEEIPIFYHGEKVGTRRKYDNKLARWLLENPWKVGRKQIARDFAAEDWDFLLDQVEFGTDYEFAPTPESEAELEALMSDEDRAQLADPAARMAARSWYLQNPPAPPRRASR